MINPAEPRMRVVSGYQFNLQGGIFFPVWTSDDDLTLRAVLLQGPAVLTTVNDFDFSYTKSRNYFENLFDVAVFGNTGQGAYWQNLVLPIPRGTVFYLGSSGLLNDLYFQLFLT